jgi:predicted ferric reductase
MRYSARRALFWLSLFLVLAVLPLLIAIVGQRPDSRDFWMELGAGLGFIGLGLLGLQFVFSGRFRSIAPSYGMDNLLQFHREAGIIAFLFVLAHPIIILVFHPEHLEYFNPAVNAPRAIALVVVTIALVLIIASSLWRLRFGLSYEQWRLVHGILSLLIIFIAVGHSLQVAHYLDPFWKKAAIAILFLVVGYLVLHTRLVRPWLSLKNPYRVVEVISERNDSYTLVMQPEGHPGMDFTSGQFVWITLGSTPFSLQQHPFSIASAPGQDSLKITAKALGDFTGSWKDLSPGTKAFLEGPFGSFTPAPDKHLFMVMGGIGVTPAMSILRNMKETNDQRHAILLYGNVNWEDVTFREELEALKQEINLTLVHVLEEPPDDWQGERGQVDAQMLEKYLPENPDDYLYLICGPNPMMDAAELALRDMGIDWRQLYTERFEII